ncbi:AtpZ/AtpI family protein [Alteribacter natronophilus]|uniref:AtpZ/AtpI family protein n=1 Tax=Alteribacter natronophilus TaxID=2583810 RepID=UPI0014863BB9|nr:AtpZ/AtpI family protein [Alteribacter natronophilus]
MSDNQKLQSVIRKMALVSTITSYFVGCILIGILGGRWLDGHFETGGLLMAAGFLIGLAAAVYGIYQVLKRSLGDDT